MIIVFEQDTGSIISCSSILFHWFVIKTVRQIDTIEFDNLIQF